MYNECPARADIPTAMYSYAEQANYLLAMANVRSVSSTTLLSLWSVDLSVPYSLSFQHEEKVY